MNIKMIFPRMLVFSDANVILLALRSLGIGGSKAKDPANTIYARFFGALRMTFVISVMTLVLVIAISSMLFAAPKEYLATSVVKSGEASKEYKIEIVRDGNYEHGQVLEKASSSKLLYKKKRSTFLEVIIYDSIKYFGIPVAIPLNQLIKKKTLRARVMIKYKGQEYPVIFIYNFKGEVEYLGENVYEVEILVSSLDFGGKRLTGVGRELRSVSGPLLRVLELKIGEVKNRSELLSYSEAVVW